MTLFSISLALFLIMDPLGNLSYYIDMVKGIEPKRQRKIVIREMLIALLTMLVFNYIGEYIFNILEISETSVRISSGLILFLTAIRILFPSIDSGIRSNLPEEEPFITPFAIPLIAGPSLLATIMLYARIEETVSVMLFAIFFAWAAAFLIFLFARQVYHFFGSNGLMACERMMGMVLVLLAIQRFMDGLRMLIENLNV